MIRYIFAILLSVNYLCLHGQNEISGKIVNENKEGIPYASIRLLQGDSIFLKGTTTDSIGYYKLVDVENGKFLLEVSSIGYKTKIQEISLPQSQETIIVLQQYSTTLEGIEVVGTRFIRQKDKVLILPDKQQVKHANTGYDLLNNLMIPGLDVDRRTGAVSTLGGSATLYIDGRKVDYREVQSLRPRDIEKVEYYDNPTGKYANDVVSINYITKKYETGGYVSLDGTQTIGYLNGDYNVVAKIDHKNTSYTFYGGANMNKYDGVRNEKTENFLFPDYTIHRQSGTNDS